MAQTNQIPMWLVGKYQKVPEILKEFFDNISDLIQYLRGNGYIKDSSYGNLREVIQESRY